MKKDKIAKAAKNLPAAPGANDHALALTVSAEANISMADIVTVAVANAEQAAKKKLDEAKALAESLSKRYEERGKELKQAIAANVDAVFGSRLKELADFVKLFGNDEPTCHGELATTKDGSLVLRVTASFSRSHTELPANAEIMAIHQDCLAIHAEHTAATNDALDWRRKLAKVDSLERHFRAKFVTHQLGQTKEGKQLLDNMTENPLAVFNTIC